MAIQIRNTKNLTDAKSFKWKVLIYGFPGVGKTSWASGAPNPGFVACETGHGRGLLSVQDQGLDYIEPSSYADVEAVCEGHVFKDKDTIIIDSGSELTKSHIKDYALTVPRTGGNSPRRTMGVPELSDYGTMGELARRLLRRLLDLPKHIIVTALLRFDKADPESGQTETIIGPDFPGAMFLGAPAMFDTVLCLRTRPAMRDKNDKTTLYQQRYFLTEPEGFFVAKCRNSVTKKPLLAREEIYDPVTGQGSWDYLFKKIIAGYQTMLDSVKT